MKHWLERYFPNWFVFGGYSDPGFKGGPLYNPEAPCDVSNTEHDVFKSIPYPVAQKLIAARDQYIAAIQQIAIEHPEIIDRYEDD